jgi:hypothetical protein
MTPDMRLNSLQNIEYGEANMQSRIPCKVEARNMPDTMSLYEPPDSSRGKYQDDSMIAINQGLLQDNMPESAFHAYYHAERGAQQHYESMLDPKLSADPKQAEEWAKDWKDGDHSRMNKEAREYADQRIAQNHMESQIYDSSKLSENSSLNGKQQSASQGCEGQAAASKGSEEQESVSEGASGNSYSY